MERPHPSLSQGEGRAPKLVPQTQCNAKLTSSLPLPHGTAPGLSMWREQGCVGPHLRESRTVFYPTPPGRVLLTRCGSANSTEGPKGSRMQLVSPGAGQARRPSAFQVSSLVSTQDALPVLGIWIWSVPCQGMMAGKDHPGP